MHTPDIIQDAIRNWSQLIGKSFAKIQPFSLPGGDELCELQLVTTETEDQFFVSSMQEDGNSDDTLFYWLSLRKERHFRPDSMVADARDFSHLLNSRICSITLWGDSRQDAVFAVQVTTIATSFCLATTRWLPNQQRFSRFGVDELCLVNAEDMSSLLERGSIQRLVTLPLHGAKRR